MLLSAQQKYIYSLLTEFHCLRRKQILTLMERAYAESKIVVDTCRIDLMISQLCHCSGRVRTQGELVMLDGAKPNYLLLEAVDVMLELSENVPAYFSGAPKKPYILRFTGSDEEARLYSVLRLDGALPELRRAPHERIIWLCTAAQLSEEVHLPPKHYLAVRQSDGTHRYYGSEEPQNTK